MPADTGDHLSERRLLLEYVEETFGRDCAVLIKEPPGVRVGERVLYRLRHDEIGRRVETTAADLDRFRRTIAEIASASGASGVQIEPPRSSGSPLPRLIDLPGSDLAWDRPLSQYAESDQPLDGALEWAFGVLFAPSHKRLFYLDFTHPVVKAVLSLEYDEDDSPDDGRRTAAERFIEFRREADRLRADADAVRIDAQWIKVVQTPAGILNVRIKKNDARHMVDVVRVLDALAFAADKHRGQRRKDAGATPYINHVVNVAQVLAAVGGIDDTTGVVAAILHDTVEDTQTTFEEIEARFGRDVRELVAEVTDDKSLPKETRKELQVAHARTLSPLARQIKIADKICNVRDITFTPPAQWPVERKREYFDWAERVVAECRLVNPRLDEEFDRVVAHARSTVATFADGEGSPERDS